MCARARLPAYTHVRNEKERNFTASPTTAANAYLSTRHPAARFSCVSLLSSFSHSSKIFSLSRTDPRPSPSIHATRNGVVLSVPFRFVLTLHIDSTKERFCRSENETESEEKKRKKKKKKKTRRQQQQRWRQTSTDSVDVLSSIKCQMLREKGSPKRFTAKTRTRDTWEE